MGKKVIAEEIAQRVTDVQAKVLANVPHEQIVQEGVAAWNVTARTVEMYILFASARIHQSAGDSKMSTPAVIKLLGLLARKVQPDQS